MLKEIKMLYKIMPTEVTLDSQESFFSKDGKHYAGTTTRRRV